MKVNELRLGNWVLYNKKYIQVDSIFEDYNGINLIHDYQCYIKSSEIKPIQITEEILLKIEGVEKHKKIKDRYVLKDSNYTFHIEDGYWSEPCLDIIKNGIYIVCVEHLHELQNTMFWLLDEELEIDL